MSMLSRFATLGGLPGDPYWANVSYLLVGNGVNGTTTNIKDSSSNNLTTNVFNGLVISTAQSKFSSGSSVFNPGNINDYATVNHNTVLNLAGTSWTIESWVYLTSAVSNKTIFSKRSPGGCSYQVYINTSGYLGFYNGTEYSSGVALPNNVWVHLAYVCNGSAVKIYIDGAQIALISATASADNTSPLYITTYLESGINQSFPGYIYDFRITKGVARYTANYTPPPFPPTSPMPTY